MNILFIGDIIGNPGRRAVEALLPELRREFSLDFVIANGENSAGGVGITKPVFDELRSYGIDVVTTGNHIWDKREIIPSMETETHLLRPANYPPGTPGRGWGKYACGALTIGVVNLAGRVYMPPVDCPFRQADLIMADLSDCDLIFFDFHAEATSEKIALGWHLAGRATAVIGTHTHVQTADERILPGGTAYMTDAGMVGARDSVLGVKSEAVLRKFLTGMPTRFEVADGLVSFNAVLLEFDMQCKTISGIKRVNREVNT